MERADRALQVGILIPYIAMVLLDFDFYAN